MEKAEIFTADNVEKERLDEFFRRVYSPMKSRFLIENGTWLSRADENRYVVRVEEQIAAYCAVIPAEINIGGQVFPAMWWIDIIVAPEFRGKGLQALLDRKIRERSDLLLGFPNELAAKIHKKHGWGVRNDIQIQLLPLWPANVKQVRKADGFRGSLLRLGSKVLGPPTALWRTGLMSLKPGHAWRMEQLDVDVLAGVYEAARISKGCTTHRSREYFDWRYTNAPEPDQFAFYLGGELNDPSLFLVARHVDQGNGVRFTRIVDIFGDIEDQETLRDIILLSIQDAIHCRSSQVTMMSSNVELQRQARRFGFVFSSPISFCWTSSSDLVMNALADSIYWVLSDSDNDEPY